MRLRFLVIALLGLLAAVQPAAAYTLGGGRLLGSAELRYGAFEASEEGTKVVDTSYFSQQYSLNYAVKGAFNHGRGGTYDLAVGYEVTDLNFEVNGDSESIYTDKLLYNGDVLLAPGGLPFRLNLYARDRHRTRLVEDNYLSRSGLEGNVVGGEGILESNAITNILNGTAQELGATLLVGIRNGSYLGRYRDVLSTLPRLLVDYRQLTVRDLTSMTPQHNRQRELAFVSLNKKDNWFHYRHTDYQDYLDHRNDYFVKSYMLGTVDAGMTRQWINLTNWIRISADGTYSIETQQRTNLPDERRFDLNMFGTAKRASWQGAVFSTFQRSNKTVSVEKEFEVPVFLKGELNRNTSWRFSFIGSRDQQLLMESSRQVDEDILFVTAQVEAFRQGRFIVAPKIEVETKQGERGEGENARVGVEVYSNRLFKPRYDLFGSYSVARFGGTSELDDDVDLWEQVATGRIETDLNNHLRVGLEERLVYGNGTTDRSISDYIAPVSDDALVDSAMADIATKGSVVRSTTTAFADYRTGRLDNRFELVFEFLDNENETQDQTSLRHSLQYRTRRVTATMSNVLIYGDNKAVGGLAPGSISRGSAVASGIAKRSFFHSSALHYSPGRAWEAMARAGYDWRETSDGSIGNLNIEQEYHYNFYAINGIVRKLAELGETLRYERLDETGEDSLSAVTLTLLGDLYPNKYTQLGAKLLYRAYTHEEFDELGAIFVAGLNFEKLTVGVDYGYGSRSSGETKPRRTEHRWQVSVKKIF